MPTWIPERPEHTRLLAGVCAGVGERFSVDVTLVRLALLVLALAWGAGIWIYLVGWLLMPDEGARGRRHAREVALANLRRFTATTSGAGRRLERAWNRTGSASWPRPWSRRWIGIALAACGTVLFLYDVGALDWVDPVGALGLTLVAVGLATVLSLRETANHR